MHQHFKAISLSYKTAPLHIREMVALEENSCKQLLVKLKEVLDISEAIAVSTCNRTEIYYTSASDQSAELIKLLGVVKGIGSENIHSYFEVINQHNEAVNYLFEVAIGIHSLVIGDMQISNQVKQAYQWSADTQMAGPFLHRLLHTIFFTNKKVVQETSFRDGAASVSYAAAELAEDLIAEIVNPKILVLGLGEIGADVCKNLASKNLNITIANRTLSKAQQIAAEYTNATVIAFENVWQAISDADVIISSIAKAEPFITRELVEKLNTLSFKYFIDLSVPRSVESRVEELPGAVVYNIDDIQNKATEALQRRINAIPKVKQIIAGAVAEFHEWTNETAVSPTINKFKNALEQIRQEEMARYMKQMSAEEAEKIDRITKGMMQKIIKLPVLQLKAACKRGEAETLIDVLNDLFNLENKPEKSNL